MKTSKICILITLIFGSLSVLATPEPKEPIQVFMAGDSTMSIKHPKDYPETGWGVPFATFFDESTKLVNLAKNGRSTRTFIEEGLWGKVMAELKEGDFVFVQFGHNDQSKHKKDRYTTPEQYRQNIEKFINEVEGRKASVILCTPVIRRQFDSKGKIRSSHAYADIVRDIAKKHKKVAFLDMEEVTRVYFEALGEKQSRLRFMHLERDLHPNYPVGMKDNTHYNELGAREVAQLALRELKKLEHPLSKRLREADPKHIRKY